MPVDVLLVKSVTGGTEAFFSSAEINGFNLTRDVPLPSIPVLDSWVKNKGFTTGFFDLDRNSLDSLLDQASEADVIGFYLNYSDNFRVLEAAKQLKKRYPHKMVVIGGPSITNLREEFFTISESKYFGLFREKVGDYVDAVVYGEGEIALETILRYRHTPDEIGKLIDSKDGAGDGIIYRDSGGIIHASANPGIVQDLSVLPIPSFRLNEGLIPVAFVETSRGCAFRCPFCEMPGLYNSRRVKNENQVRAEIDFLQETGIRHVIITDPAIYPSQRMDMLSGIFAGRGMTWTGYAKPGWWKNDEPLYSKNTLQKAYDSGCISLFFGGESASEKTQELYGKPKLEVLRETERLCKEVGLQSCWSFMILNPGETSRDIDKLLDLLIELNPAMTVFGPFSVMPDSAIGRNPGEFNIKVRDRDYRLKGADYYTRFSKSAGVERKKQIGYLIEKYPRLMRLVIKAFMGKANYFKSIETGLSVSDGAFEMLRLDGALSRKTNIKVGKSNYHLLFELAANGADRKQI